MTGDINIDLLRPNKPITSQNQDILSSLNLHQHVHKHDKTKVMILSTLQMSRVHHLDEYDPNIVVSGYKLERIKSCKLLGVHINEHLKWDDHITHTVSILRKLKYLAKYELRKQLVETLILSKLDYVDLVFFSFTTILTSPFETSSICCCKFCTQSLCQELSGCT